MKKEKIAIILVASLMSLSSCGNTVTDVSVPNDEITESSTSENSEEILDSTSSSESELDENNEELIEDNPLGKTANINDYIDSNEINPPLWKVTDSVSGNTLYLLGTIHMLPSDVSDYPSDLMDIYHNCDSIAVEYDVTLMSL